MVGRSIAAIALPMLFSSFMSAQASQRSTQASKGPPKIRVAFPSGISLDNVWLGYGLFGPNGGRVYIGLPGSLFNPVRGQGRVVEPKLYPDHYYEVVALEDGNPVDHFKALAWARGCQMVAFDVAVGKDDTVLAFTCTPLKSITLAGHVQQVDFGGQSPTLTVGFDSVLLLLNLNLCTNGCELNGPELQIPDIATAEVARDGSFKVDLPDFALDPLVSGDSSAEFLFYLTDRQIALEPQAGDLRFAMRGLKVETTYPSNLVFVPRQYNSKPSSASPTR
jgi:hypothetical protein